MTNRNRLLLVAFELTTAVSKREYFAGLERSQPRRQTEMLPPLNSASAASSPARFQSAWR